MYRATSLKVQSGGGLQGNVQRVQIMANGKRNSVWALNIGSSGLILVIVSGSIYQEYEKLLCHGEQCFCQRLEMTVEGKGKGKGKGEGEGEEETY